MKIPIQNEARVAVVGGGIAGLAAAWYLQSAGLDVIVLEASDRFGGLIHTLYEDDLTVEFGPDAFITRKPWALALAQELGLGGELVTVNDTPERIYVLADGQLVPLPDGLRLLVPTDIGAFLASPIMSMPGKVRALLDWVIPARVGDDDEALADFVIRRMGHEALDKLADPLLAGVYNADMHEQSILATFPQYRQLEQRHGSLIRGMLHAAAARSQDDRDSAQPALLSFRRGMGQLIDALVTQLTGDLRLNSRAKRVHDNGHVELESGECIESDAVVVATPAYVAANLLADAAPVAAVGLSQIRYAGIGSVSLAFERDQVPHALDAYGIVIPSSAGRSIDGMQWSSAKWSGRAPDDSALIRVFFGGPHTRAMLDCSEVELLAIVREELRAMLGVTAKPRWWRIGKWQHAYPQYDVGHLGHVAAIEAALPDSIRVAGNAYHGVGVPDTIKTAQAAAQHITDQMTIT